MSKILEQVRKLQNLEQDKQQKQEWKERSKEKDKVNNIPNFLLDKFNSISDLDLIELLTKAISSPFILDFNAQQTNKGVKITFII